MRLVGNDPLVQRDLEDEILSEFWIALARPQRQEIDSGKNMRREAEISWADSITAAASQATMHVASRFAGISITQTTRIPARRAEYLTVSDAGFN